MGAEPDSPDSSDSPTHPDGLRLDGPARTTMSPAERERERERAVTPPQTPSPPLLRLFLPPSPPPTPPSLLPLQTPGRRDVLILYVPGLIVSIYMMFYKLLFLNAIIELELN